MEELCTFVLLFHAIFGHHTGFFAVVKRFVKSMRILKGFSVQTLSVVNLGLGISERIVNYLNTCLSIRKV